MVSTEPPRPNAKILKQRSSGNGPSRGARTVSVPGRDSTIFSLRFAIGGRARRMRSRTVPTISLSRDAIRQRGLPCTQRSLFSATFHAYFGQPRKGRADGPCPSGRGDPAARSPEAASRRGAHRAWHCLRRYRHQPALWAQASRDAGGTPAPETVMGIVSLIFWALILIVALKYAILILRADNRGEGGIVALLALLDARHAPRGSWRASLLDRRLDRGRAALWRRRDHAGDLGAQRRRRPEARRTCSSRRWSFPSPSRSWLVCSWSSAREPSSSATSSGR